MPASRVTTRRTALRAERCGWLAARVGWTRPGSCRAIATVVLRRRRRLYGPECTRARAAPTSTAASAQVRIIGSTRLVGHLRALRPLEAALTPGAVATRG